MVEMRKSLRRLQARLLAGRGARFVRLVVRRIREDRLQQAVPALTYNSLLALVPLITVWVSVLSALSNFSGHISSVQASIMSMLVPEIGEAVGRYITQFTARAERIGAAGTILLVITSLMLVSNIETTFNRIWRVRRSRPTGLRVLSYWALLSLGPILFTVAVLASDWFFRLLRGAGVDRMAFAWELAVRLLPVLAELLLLSLLYGLLPNRKVRWLDACTGAVVATVVLEAAKFCFGLYLRAYPAYGSIYGALSTLMIFLLWVYLLWSSVLAGGVIAACLPEWRAGAGEKGEENQWLQGSQLSLALGIFRELALDRRGIDREGLVQLLRRPNALIEPMTERLQTAGYLARNEHEKLFIACDIHGLSLWQLKVGLGLAADQGLPDPALAPDWQKPFIGLMQKLAATEEQQLAISIADLVEALPPRPASEGKLVDRPGAEALKAVR
jgi:membrane protein